MEKDYFNMFARACMLAMTGWIALSVAHLPALEQKLDDYIVQVDNKFTVYDLRLNNLEKGK